MAARIVLVLPAESATAQIRGGPHSEQRHDGVCVPLLSPPTKCLRVHKPRLQLRCRGLKGVEDYTVSILGYILNPQSGYKYLVHMYTQMSSAATYASHVCRGWIVVFVAVRGRQMRLPRTSGMAVKLRKCRHLSRRILDSCLV